MEERRSNGFRVKPSFGQVLGYIQEGEPLTLDLPNRKASIYTSSHFYLDDYPNAPEPVSETPLPHTSLNPAAAFETADEGYSGTPFPRPPREFTRPSFLPDSDDGGMDPGQALRNDGLNPPRPPTLGGRLRESGIQAAETVIAGAAAGAAAATRSVTENQTTLALRGGGDWLDRTLRIPRRPPTPCRREQHLLPPPPSLPSPHPRLPPSPGLLRPAAPGRHLPPPPPQPPALLPPLPPQQWRSLPMLPPPRPAAMQIARCPGRLAVPPPPPVAPPSPAGAPLPRAVR